MLTFFSILAVGFLLGMRHATDPDHVVAVTTIVSRERSTGSAALIGAFWGIGHTLTIFVVGAGIILFDIVIPARLGLSMELCVGIMLIVLGIWNLTTFVLSTKLIARNAQTAIHPPVPTREHSHGRDVHSHWGSHDDGQATGHAVFCAGSDLKKDGYSRYIRPLFVGIVHGLAGSAAVALLILASIRNSSWAIAYLLVFGIGTIAGMMLITTGITSTLRIAGHRFESFSQRLGLVSGLVSIAFGCFVAYQICVVYGLFSSHPNWIPN